MPIILMRLHEKRGMGKGGALAECVCVFFYCSFSGCSFGKDDEDDCNGHKNTHFVRSTIFSLHWRTPERRRTCGGWCMCKQSAVQLYMSSEHVFVAAWNANALSQRLFVSIKAYIQRPKCWPFFSHILQHNDDVRGEGRGGGILACCLCVCSRFVCMPYFSRPFDAGSGKDACLWRRHKSKRIYTSMFVQIVKVPIPLNGVYVLLYICALQHRMNGAKDVSTYSVSYTVE